MKNPIVLTLLVIITWGIWPILAKRSGASANLLTILTSFLSTCVTITYLLKYNGASTVVNDLKLLPWLGIILLSIAGIINGFGMVGYGALFASANKFEISTYIPIISGLIPIVSAIGAYLFLHETITPQKIIGTMIICVGVYIINKY